MIVIAVSDLSASPFDDPDDEPLRAALARAGWPARVAQWDDPADSWEDAELVVLRSTWDYVDRLDDFLAWMRRVSSVTRVVNPLPVVEWNSDKAYLGQLSRLGVPVVPTWYLDRLGDLPAVLAGLAAQSAAEVVVKPSVSNGSGFTGRFEPADDRLRELAGRILAAGKRVMVQPYLDSVTTDGEAALVYLGGEFSHAVRKGPLLAAGGGLLGGSYTEVITSITPTPQQRRAADQVLAAASGVCGGDLHYARVDLVAGPDGDPLCLELEVIEPSLFLSESPGSADRFVEVLRTLAPDAGAGVPAAAPPGPS